MGFNSGFKGLTTQPADGPAAISSTKQQLSTAPTAVDLSSARFNILMKPNYSSNKVKVIGKCFANYREREREQRVVYIEI